MPTTSKRRPPPPRYSRPEPSLDGLMAMTERFVTTVVTIRPNDVVEVAHLTMLGVLWRKFFLSESRDRRAVAARLIGVDR